MISQLLPAVLMVALVKVHGLQYLLATSFRFLRAGLKQRTGSSLTILIFMAMSIDRATWQRQARSFGTHGCAAYKSNVATGLHSCGGVADTPTIDGFSHQWLPVFLVLARPI